MKKIILSVSLLCLSGLFIAADAQVDRTKQDTTNRPNRRIPGRTDTMRAPAPMNNPVRDRNIPTPNNPTPNNPVPNTPPVPPTNPMNPPTPITPQTPTPVPPSPGTGR